MENNKQIAIEPCGIYCDIQWATEAIEIKAEQNELPTEAQVIQWLTPLLSTHSLYAEPNAELTIRFVDADEMIMLNHQYRHKNSTTNVLSFPFEVPEGLPETLPLLGDIVLCPAVIEAEASQQNKPIEAHYAHLIIHGCLHLLGFDHIDPEEAIEMETLETKFIVDLGWDDPYYAN